MIEQYFMLKLILLCIGIGVSALAFLWLVITQIAGRIYSRKLDRLIESKDKASHK